MFASEKHASNGTIQLSGINKYVVCWYYLNLMVVLLPPNYCQYKRRRLKFGINFLMRCLLTICFLLTAATAHAAIVGKQVQQADISTPLGYDLIYKKLLETNSLAHEFQKTGQLNSGFQAVAAEQQLEKLLENSTLQCTMLQRQFTPDEAKLLFAHTMDIVKQFDNSLQTFVSLKEKYGIFFNAAGIESHIKGLEERVDLLGDCFQTHLADDMAKNATEIRAQIDKLFAAAYAQLKN
jgi:hypothetical protein